MPGIFISYRRDDSGSDAIHLYDRLRRQFTLSSVFIDVNSIFPGTDFVNSLNAALSKCDCFLAVIGPNWLNSQDKDGRRRLDQPDDWVRLEIEAGLRTSSHFLPVLVSGASMPLAEQLPKSLAGLNRSQGIEIRNSSWDRDFDYLVQTLQRRGQKSNPASVPTPVLPKRVEDELRNKLALLQKLSRVIEKKGQFDANYHSFLQVRTDTVAILYREGLAADAARCQVSAPAVIPEPLPRAVFEIAICIKVLSEIVS